MSNQPNVLVVDDDSNILAAFEDFLRKENCLMMTAFSIEDALKKLEEHHFDLIVTDIRVKFQSGITFLLRIKGSRPKLPVIVITGHPDLVTEEDAKMFGADYFFLKPLEIEKLREAVRKCLHFNNISSH